MLYMPDSDLMNRFIKAAGLSEDDLSSYEHFYNLVREVYLCTLGSAPAQHSLAHPPALHLPLFEPGLVMDMYEFLTSRQSSPRALVASATRSFLLAVAAHAPRNVIMDIGLPVFIDSSGASPAPISFLPCNGGFTFDEIMQIYYSPVVTEAGWYCGVYYLTRAATRRDLTEDDIRRLADAAATLSPSYMLVMFIDTLYQHQEVPPYVTENLINRDFEAFASSHRALRSPSLTPGIISRLISDLRRGKYYDPRMAIFELLLNPNCPREELGLALLSDVEWERDAAHMVIKVMKRSQLQEV